MLKQFETVSVIGLGYIGLPTAAVLAARGPKVIGVDVNPKAVEIINSGGVHIVEPGLDVIVKSVVQQGRLRATLKPEKADAFVIAVPTPFKGSDHEPDISYVESAARSIAPVLVRGSLVVLESTSPVGTTERVCELLQELRPDLKIPSVGSVGPCDVFVAYCPERVLPGYVLRELTENDRVIGGVTPACAERAADLYRLFVKGECVITNTRTAEMTKLTENSFRDVNIAFANELSMICEKLDINVWELIALANRHPRVKILQPGPGVGGHCISVDPWFIVHKTPEQARLIRTAREVNDSKPHFVLEQIRTALNVLKQVGTKGTGGAGGLNAVSFYGLAFKPDIDDLRESPAVEVVEMFAREMLVSNSSMQVCVVEPFVSELPRQLQELKNVRLVSLSDALTQGALHVLLVNHQAFKNERNKLLAASPWIDTRGMLALPKQNGSK